MVGFHTGIDKTMGKGVRLLVEFLIGIAALGIHHGNGLLLGGSMLLQHFHKGDIAVERQLLSAAHGEDGLLCLCIHDLHFVETGIRMSHHVFRSSLDGISSHADGETAVQGIAAFHTDIVLAFALVDDTRQVSVNLALGQLYRGASLAVEFEILLHVITLETKGYSGLDAKLLAEMTEGIDAIADGRHQLTTETFDEVKDRLLRNNVCQDGYALDEHAVGTHQTLVHTTVVHTLVDHLLLPRQPAHHQTEGSHVEQVTAGAVVLTPLVDSVYRHEGTLAYHIAQTASGVGSKADEVTSFKFLLIILRGALVVLRAERLLLVLSIFIHAIFRGLQALAIIGCGDVIKGDVGSQCQTVTNGMVNV